MKAVTLHRNVARWMTAKGIGFFSPRIYTSPLVGLALRDVPVPALPSPHWVRLRTLLGGICGTDLAALSCRAHPASFLQNMQRFPFLLGHECVAVVDEVGPAVTDWRPGDRVCVEPALSCAPREIDPPCPPCTRGLFSLCRNTHAGVIPPAYMIGYNGFTGGSWSEYFVAHRSQLFRVPDALPDEIAVLTDPLACALHAALRAAPAPDDRVLIQGDGFIGLALLASLRALGCAVPITVLGHREERLALAASLGATATLHTRRDEPAAQRYDRLAALVGARRVPGRFGSHGLLGGFDLVYDCVGTGDALTDAAKFTRERGTLVAVGTSSIAVVDTTPLWFTELNVVGCSGRQLETVDGHQRHTYELVFDLIARGALRPELFPTRTYALHDFRAALHDALTGRARPALKVLFKPDV